MADLGADVVLDVDTDPTASASDDGGMYSVESEDETMYSAYETDVSATTATESGTETANSIVSSASETISSALSSMMETGKRGARALGTKAGEVRDEVRRDPVNAAFWVCITLPSVALLLFIIIIVAVSI